SFRFIPGGREILLRASASSPLVDADVAGDGEEPRLCCPIDLIGRTRPMRFEESLLEQVVRRRRTEAAAKKCENSRCQASKQRRERVLVACQIGSHQRLVGRFVQSLFYERHYAGAPIRLLLRFSHIDVDVPKGGLDTARPDEPYRLNEND